VSTQYREGLFRHSLLLMAATQVGNVSTTLYQVVMGRTLTEAQYAVLASMLGVVLIFATPMDALRTATAHFSARLTHDGRRGDVKRLCLKWGGVMSIPALALLVVGILGAGWLAGLFQLNTWVPVVIAIVTVALNMFLPMLGGSLQGLQSFFWMSVCQQGWGVLRLLLVLLLIFLFGATPEVGLTAQLLASAGAGALGLLGLYVVIGRETRTSGDLPHMRYYMAHSLFILAGYAVIMNADVVLAKIFFPAEEAGRFAQAAMIGRSIVFFPLPVALAMFPKVASGGETTAKDWSNLLKAGGAVVALILTIVGACHLYPEFPLYIMFNKPNPDPEMIRLVRATAWAMSPLGLVYLLVNFELAQHRFGAALPLVFAAGAYVAGVSLVHRTVWDVVMILRIVSIGSVLLMIAGLPWRSLRRASPAPGGKDL
jgi:O-antigen/teichoic acid export membrane protein